MTQKFNPAAASMYMGKTFAALVPNGIFYGTIAAIHQKGDRYIIIPANVPVEAFNGGFEATPESSITIYN
jgi:hypothetical protein